MKLYHVSEKHLTWNASSMRVIVVECDTVRFIINPVPSKYSASNVIQIL